jgi:hypothetical protein
MLDSLTYSVYFIEPKEVHEDWVGIDVHICRGICGTLHKITSLQLFYISSQSLLDNLESGLKKICAQKFKNDLRSNPLQH